MEVLELVTLKGRYPGIAVAEIAQQAEDLREKLTDQAIGELVDGVRLPQVDRDFLKRRLRERRDYIVAAVLGGSVKKAVEVQLGSQQRLLNILEGGDLQADPNLRELIPEWTRLSGPEGYQHDGGLVGAHTEDVVRRLKDTPEWQQLDTHGQALALVSAFFHDFGKPTGNAKQKVERDFEHELKSVLIAGRYLRELGFSLSDIETVCKVINNDGVVTDILRGRERADIEVLTPVQLAERLGDKRTLLILKALNRVDAVSVVGQSSFDRISAKYDEFFSAALANL